MQAHKLQNLEIAGDTTINHIVYDDTKHAVTDFDIKVQEGASLYVDRLNHDDVTDLNINLGKDASFEGPIASKSTAEDLTDVTVVGDATSELHMRFTSEGANKLADVGSKIDLTAMNGESELRFYDNLLPEDKAWAGNIKVDLGAGGTTTIAFAGAFGTSQIDIENFTAGAGEDVDVLDFTAIVAPGLNGTVDDATGSQVIAADQTWVVNYQDGAITAKDFAGADFAELFHATDGYFLDGSALADGEQIIVAVQGDDRTELYLATNSGGTAFDADDIVLIGTLDITQANMLHGDNIV